VVQEPLAGEVVVLATPYDAALDFAGTRSEELAGKVVVDISNPVDWTSFDRLVTPADSSATEESAARTPGARVVKAFNTGRYQRRTPPGAWLSPRRRPTFRFIGR
jgi:8-hydroxy-5-deazaflavin:NADPH oxidoreductase